jgi:hypothetical protein
MTPEVRRSRYLRFLRRDNTFADLLTNDAPHGHGSLHTIISRLRHPPLRTTSGTTLGGIRSPW